MSTPDPVGPSENKAARDLALFGHLGVHPYDLHFFQPTGAAATGPKPGIISLISDNLGPPNTVEIANEYDGWGMRSPGVYRMQDHAGGVRGVWTFHFAPQGYPDPLQVRFHLNDSATSVGQPISVSVGAGAELRVGSEVIFPAGTPTHPSVQVDGLRPERTEWMDGRFRSTRKAEEEFDTIVIGGGMMGGLVGNGLSNKGRRTLVVELGTRQFTTHLSNLHRQPDANALLSRCARISGPLLDGTVFMLGGRSLIWSGNVPRLMPWELDRPEWLGDIATALRDEQAGGGGYYRRAEELLRKAPTLGPHAEACVKELARMLPGFTVEQMGWAYDLRRSATNNPIFASTGIFNTADLLNDSADPADPGSAHLAVRTGMMALRLERTGNRIDRLKCYDMQSGEVRWFRARRFVLALGAVLSPNLVLVSELPNQSGLAGVGLTDHPTYDLNEYGNPFYVPANSPLCDPDGHAKLMLMRRDSTNANMPIIGELGINTQYWHQRFTDPALQPTIPRDRVAFYLDAMSYGELEDRNRIIPQGEGKLPLIQYHWYRTGAYGDFTNLERMLKEFRNQVLHQMGAAFDSKITPKNKPQGTIHHAGGSLRMGTPVDGCVDENLRYHGVDNLYVADASVMPYAITPKPSLTIAALALRLVDHLA